METNISRLPIASLVVAGASSLTLLSITIGVSRPVVLVACLGALLGLMLGVAGVLTTRGRVFHDRLPAFIAILLGGIVFLWAGLVFVLTTPF